MQSVGSNRIRADGQIITDATIAAGTVILRSPAQRFRPTDAGRYISVLGAGAHSTVLITTIGEYVDSSAIRLAQPALTSAAGTTVLWGTDDTSAIQSSLDALHAAGGGNLQLPTGICILATPPHDGFTLLKSRTGVSVSGVGPRSVLMVGPGIRDKATGIAVLYNHTEPLSDIVYRDFCIDFNGEHNLLLRGYGVRANVNRMGGGAGCSRILVDNLILRNSAGHHFLYFAGENSSAVTIRNSTFQEFGQSIPGNEARDFSGVYLDADSSEISGCTFENARPCNISTAIETHGASLKIHDNHVINSSTAYNLGSDTRSVRDIDFHNNTLRGVVYGVVVWTAKAFLLSNAKIHDNTMALREATAPYPAGAGVTTAAKFNKSSINISGLEIQNNVIAGESLRQVTTLTTGLFLQRVDDLLVSGNKVRDLVAEAIYLASEAVPRSINHIKILNNDISNVGTTNLVGRKQAIALNSLRVSGGLISDIEISNNTITLSPASGNAADYGIKFNGGSFPDTRITGNTIVGFRRAPIFKAARMVGDMFLVDGTGPCSPCNCIRATIGSWWLDTSTQPPRTFAFTRIEHDGESTGWQFVSTADSPPLHGDYMPGDTVYHTRPGDAGFVGWVCTDAGSPGKWKRFGELTE